MAEHEQGAERWESVPGIGRNPPSYTKKGKRWLSNAAGVVMELNRLEADLAALRQQLADAEAKAALADDIFNGNWDWYDIAPDGGEFRCNYCDAMAEKVKDMKHHGSCPKSRYDALASPSRDTVSAEGKG